jgi:NDP-sugar pyrophosphorylase family protein/thiamine kinase-like enzyme
MKALILAAGFGKRLLPYTKHTPKPLFPVQGSILLDTVIMSLKSAGCNDIMINTHYLHKEIERFIAEQNYSIQVQTIYEPVPLGTGGAVKNLEDFWDDQPFIVMNSDILTDIDIAKVYRFHKTHAHPATLVVCDYPEFNKVIVNKDNFILNFYGRDYVLTTKQMKKLTFAGIQVLDPEILDFIELRPFSNIIDAYCNLKTGGKKIKALIADQNIWTDIGTPETYRQAVFQSMAPSAFNIAFKNNSSDKISVAKLKGDGSDRIWQRLSKGKDSIIMVDHGIRETRQTSEVDSFINIGRHLTEHRIPVPRIYLSDNFSGLVFLEDLGDTHLQEFVRNCKNSHKIADCYKSLINLLVQMSVSGAKGFDPSMTWQTPYYDPQFIIEYECRYFVNAFLKTYLKTDTDFQVFESEFNTIAHCAASYGINGFMHRDLQSRNIMVKDSRYYFIDFQGGRIGPIQYDLASLLIDPYVQLSENLRNSLLNYCMNRLSSAIRFAPEEFQKGYKYCALTRNLQILGAFGYLARIKGKTYFEKYIPTAIRTLKNNLAGFHKDKFPNLTNLVTRISSGTACKKLKSW